MSVDSHKHVFKPFAAATVAGFLLVGCSSTPAAPTPNEPVPSENNKPVDVRVDMDDDGDEVMDDDGDERMAPSSAAAMEKKPEDAMMAKTYADGTYTADGTYKSPAGSEEVTIGVTLKAGVVTAVEYTPEAVNPKSDMFQDKFKEGLSAQVVGKSIDSISLTVVNGSSLTPMGFMDALEKIKLEAAAKA